MLQKCIGIISYLPDDVNKRNYRRHKLDILLQKCWELFNLPTCIIAQNYFESDIWYFKTKYPHVVIQDNLNALGITGARKALRAWFLKSQYDYLIMLDDDIELEGTSGTEYLKQIDENPECFIENNKSRLQLFAISKTIFKEIDFGNINPENEEGFEDRVFFYTLCHKYPDKHKKFQNTRIAEHALATADPNSTWYVNQNLSEMLLKTQKIIDSKTLKK